LYDLHFVDDHRLISTINKAYDIDRFALHFDAFTCASKKRELSATLSVYRLRRIESAIESYRRYCGSCFCSNEKPTNGKGRWIMEDRRSVNDAIQSAEDACVL